MKKGMIKQTGKAATGITYLRQRFADALSTRKGDLVAERGYGADIDDLVDDNVDDTFRMRLFGRVAAAIQNPINGLIDLTLKQLQLNEYKDNTVEIVALCEWQHAEISLATSFRLEAA